MNLNLTFIKKKCKFHKARVRCNCGNCDTASSQDGVVKNREAASRANFFNYLALLNSADSF
jgi:hypothetical protein